VLESGEETGSRPTPAIQRQHYNDTAALRSQSDGDLVELVQMAMFPQSEWAVLAVPGKGFLTCFSKVTRDLVAIEQQPMMLSI
jgi:hypothetical protein